VHDADQDVKEIALVDCDGNETDISQYFNDSIELLTGGYTNGVGPLQAMDTLTVNTNQRDITSAIKTTTGAGSAGFDSATDISITEDERCYLKIDLTLNSGVAPSVRLVDAGDYTVARSNTILLTNGVNHIILTVTDTDASASLLFFNNTADQANYSAEVNLVRTNRPTVYEFTDVDYIQYNGKSLTNPFSTIISRAWVNIDYDTLTSADTAITSGIKAAGNAEAGLNNTNPDMEIISGRSYKVYVPNVVINSGQAPRFGLHNGSIYISPIVSTSAGDNELTLTATETTRTGMIRVSNSDAADWECGPVEVIDTTLNSLLPKGTHYLRVSDGVNEWYSEWFEIRDIYENLVTSMGDNVGYETLETDGTRVTSAINTAGNGVIYSEANNDDFDIENDEVITVILFLTLNSGALPGISLTTNDTTSVISNAPTLAEGINVVTLTATQAAEQARIRIFNSANSNFSTSEIWVKRQYASDFVKLQFTNATDLRGKRSDDQTILYQNSFEQECWLNTILNTPESNPLEVGDEKDGLFIAEKVVSQQIYRIIDYVNRSLFEGLLRLPQHDDITIIDEVGNQYTPNIGNIRISIEWTTFDTGTLVIAFNDGSFVWTENSDDIT